MIKEWGIIRDRFILPYNEVKEILYLDYVQTGSIPCPPVSHHPGFFHIGFVSIFVIVDLIENLDRFIDNNVPTRVVVSYYLYTLPWFV